MKLFIITFYIFFSLHYTYTFGQSKPAIVVVLCDVSKSVSKLKINEKSSQNTQIIALKSTLFEIPPRFRDNSEIYYLQVSENATNLPIGGNAVTKRRVTEMEKPKENLRIKAEVSRISEKIDQLATVKNENQISCLLTSVSNAYRFLCQKKKQKGDMYNYHLIILSDMLEYCDSFTNFKKNMETAEGLIDLKKNIVKLDLSTINFDKQKIRINIVSTSPDMSEKTLREVQGVWDILFKKMGYSKQALISSSL